MKSKLGTGLSEKGVSNKAVCLICFEWFKKSTCPSFPDQEVVEISTGKDGDEVNHGKNPHQNTSAPDLYIRFLTFIRRYLGLESSGSELLKNAKAKKDTAGEGVQPFCGKCQFSVELLCDLFRDLEELKMRLAWGLSELGSRMDKGQKSVSTKLRKMILKKLKEEMNAQDLSSVEGLRKRLVQKCKWKAKKLCRQPQIRVHPGPNPDFMKSVNESMIIQLIVISWLGSSNLTSHIYEKSNPIDEELSIVPEREDTDHATDDEDESNHSAFSPPAFFDNDDNGVETDQSEEEPVPLKRLRRSRSPSIVSNVTDPLNTDDDTEVSSTDTEEDDRKPKAKRKRRASENVRNRMEQAGTGTGYSSDSSMPKAVSGKTCKDCSETFSTRMELSAHRREVHKFDIDVNECPICFKPVRGHTKLERHLKRHEEDRKEILFCGVCTKTFWVQQNLNEHLIEIHGGAYKCLQSECGESYSSAHELRDHLESVHEAAEDEEKRFCCRFCLRPFATRQYFNIHRKILHHRSRFFCDKKGCSVECSSTEALKDHIKMHVVQKVKKENEGTANEENGTEDRVQEQIFCCSTCDRSFYEKYNLTLHQLIHTPQSGEGKAKAYECPECGLKNRYMESLIGHFDYKHGSQIKPSVRNSRIRKYDDGVRVRGKRLKLVKCEEPGCNETFMGTVKLEAHLAKDHGRKEFMHPCHICGRAFIDMNKVKRHIVKVHEGRSYQCEKCPKVFKDAYYFKNHCRYAHSEEKRPANRICSVCGAAFISGQGLTDHMKSKHENLTYPCTDCGIVYQSKKGLAFHIMAKHMDDSQKKFTCSWCGKKEHRKDLHRQHEKNCSKRAGASHPPATRQGGRQNEGENDHVPPEIDGNPHHDNAGAGSSNRAYATWQWLTGQAKPENV